jgi:hypothetical protein
VVSRRFGVSGDLIQVVLQVMSTRGRRLQAILELHFVAKSSGGRSTVRDNPEGREKWPALRAAVFLAGFARMRGSAQPPRPLRLPHTARSTE